MNSNDNDTINDALIEAWAVFYRKECSDRASEIDPEDEIDWFGLTLGWALAKGMSVVDAHAFAVKVYWE